MRADGLTGAIGSSQHRYLTIGCSSSKSPMMLAWQSEKRSWDSAIMASTIDDACCSASQARSEEEIGLHRHEIGQMIGLLQ